MKNNTPDKAVRIFLVDDDPAMRQGLKELLAQEAYIVCGDGCSSNETLERIEESNADMALLDFSPGRPEGLAHIAELRRRGIVVLISSMHEDAGTIKKAFAAGAAGYVTKRELSDTLLAIVPELAAGRRYVSPRAALSLANRALSSPG